MDSISSDVDTLNSQAIVEDYFWSNPEMKIENEGCFGNHDVEAGETINFDA